MNKFLFLTIACWLFSVTAMAQSTDTTARMAPDSNITDQIQVLEDSATTISYADSISKKPAIVDTVQQIHFTMPVSFFSLTADILQKHPYFGFGKELSQLQPGAVMREYEGKEPLFYLVVLLLLIYGVLKLLFPKYFDDLFRLFFRTTLKQRQIKEQLMQTPLPSLLLNGFFILSAGLYISLVVKHFEINPAGSFWMLLLYACAGLSIIYFIKFAGLKITGWLFGMEETADSYIFIVFVVNKMLGILLLPFIVFIAFSTNEIYSISLLISYCVAVGLLAYRLVLTWAAIRNQVKVNPFHFFLYVCAFEIAPLLLIYKGLMLFFGISA